MKIVASIIIFLFSANFVFSQIQGSSWDEIEFDTVPKFYYQEAELDTFVYLFAEIPKWIDLMEINAVSLNYIYVDSIRLIWVDKKPTINIDYHGLVVPQYKKDAIFDFYKRETWKVIRESHGLWLPAIRNNRVLKKSILFKVAFITQSHTDQERRNYKPVNNFDLELKTISDNSIRNRKLLYDFAERKFSERKFLLAEKYYGAAYYYNEDTLSALNCGICHYKMKDTLNACYYWDLAKDKKSVNAKQYLKNYSCERRLEEKNKKLTEWLRNEEFKRNTNLVGRDKRFY